MYYFTNVSEVIHDNYMGRSIQNNDSAYNPEPEQTVVRIRWPRHISLLDDKLNMREVYTTSER